MSNDHQTETAKKLAEFNQEVEKLNQLEFQRRQIEMTIGFLNGQRGSELRKIFVDDTQNVFQMESVYLIESLENYLPLLGEKQKQIIKKIKS